MRGSLLVPLRLLAAGLLLLLPHGARAEAVPLHVANAIRLESPGPDGNRVSYLLAFESAGVPFRSAAYETELHDSIQRVGQGTIVIVPARTARLLDPEQLNQTLAAVERGAVLVTEEVTPLSERLGFRGGPVIEVRQIEEAAYPEVMIVWQQPGGVAALEPPAAAEILTREKWTRAALSALVRHGRGSALVLATELDPSGAGYARFPYFLHQLRRAGVTFPFRDERLAALFDYGYRSEVDVVYFARKWRDAGIRDLFVSAWHFWEPDAERDKYLKELVEACHRYGILVHAWVEFPHVSQAFWNAHPAWREKTATGQDAQLDWRYLMNLKDPECYRAAVAGLRRLLNRFDWDGVNLSELYLESPQGPANPQRFTPFSAQARSEFKRQSGIDPAEFFREGSPRYWKKDAAAWARFVDYRVNQVWQLNEAFLRELSRTEQAKRGLRLSATFVDNLYDPKMREAIGADVAAMLPLLGQYDFTLILEDPGSVWHLGPRRYAELAAAYAKLTSRTSQLGIDINVVERFQDVYPTKKQTGVEFLELFHYAGAHFRTVLAYFEQSILPQDLELVANALANGASGGNSNPQAVRIRTERTTVFDTGVPDALFSVDGRPWPCVDRGRVLLPAGEFMVSAESPGGELPARLVRLNGDLRSARYDGSAIEFTYQSQWRAIAVFDRAIKAVAVDNRPLASPPGSFVMLPPGAHTVTATF